MAEDIETTPTSWRDDVIAAVPGWLVARAVVGLAWLLNAALVAVRRDGVDPETTRQGLFAWDGAYYRSLAELGYQKVEFDGIRFHPLVPLLGVNGFGVLLLANLSALAAGALVHRLAAVTTGDRDLARRAATLVALAPPAFCLVWAYAEGPFLVLGALQLLALRRRRWWWAAAAALLAALTRPAGLLLAVPALVEGARWLRRSSPGERTAARIAGLGAAVLAPAAGIALFLGWAERATGEGMLAVRVQQDLRDGFVLPPIRLLQGLAEVVREPLGDGLHIPFAFGMVALVWVCWRRLPLSWTALAVASVLAALAAGNLNSIERYAFGALPVVVALAAVTGGRWWRPAIAVSTLGLLGMTTLAWYGSVVP